MITFVNSKNQEVVVTRHEGEKFDFPVIAKVYPKESPFWNAEYKEYWGLQYFSIRKLTEGECLRLMDVPEDMIVRMCEEEKLSRSSIYKLAGNSIVVNCLRLIYKNIYMAEDDPDDAFNLFPEPTFKAPLPKKINLVTLCSGYDSQLMALDNFCKEANIERELLAWSEFDPESNRPLENQPAVIAHNVLFPEYSERNVGDMTKVDWNLVKSDWGGQEVDILTYSTPCQSISQAGKREGMTEGSGTRSAVLWHTEDAIKSLRPKFLLQENVKAIVSDVNMPDFKKWQDRVKGLGYTNYYTIMNAKDYGVPQNRERMFMLSVRNDLLGVDGQPLPRYRFHKPFKLDKCIADVLDENVESYYFLQPDSVLKFLQKNEEDSVKGIKYMVVDHHLNLDELETIWNEG